MTLPSKLLILTIVFVMVAEVMIFGPSIANFRINWLQQRVLAARIAALSMEAAHGVELPDMLREDLLDSAAVHAVSWKHKGIRKLVLGMPPLENTLNLHDLRTTSFFQSMCDAFEALFTTEGRLVRILSAPEMMPDDEIDIVIDTKTLHEALWTYAGNTLWLSLLISVISAILVYATLNILIVRPMMKLTRNMMLYRENPEDGRLIILPSNRSDEIGIAERELASLQKQLTRFIQEKSRLANIGLSVSKISHDLRNMLAGAQVVSDRLALISDPTVQRFTPRLIRALDRAIGLCADTLKYGRSQEHSPRYTRFSLLSLFNEIEESLGLDTETEITVLASISPSLFITADRDHLFRVLSNLIRNAFEALKSEHLPFVTKEVSISAAEENSNVAIRVSDNGPGIPQRARSNLFKAFQSSSRQDGTGLGLVICSELIQAHNGTIQLEDSDHGTTFLIMLPSPTKIISQQHNHALVSQRHYN